MLAFLAGAYVARFADRRDAAGDSEPRDEVPSDVPPVGDVAINAAFVPGKNYELTAFRSLAAVFREELGPENGAELPATSPPECLVSYGVDVIPPRTELLPLQDGSQALVATLVADVPGNGPTAPAREAGYSELLPAGSADGFTARRLRRLL